MLIQELGVVILIHASTIHEYEQALKWHEKQLIHYSYKITF